MDGVNAAVTNTRRQHESKIKARNKLAARYRAMLAAMDVNDPRAKDLHKKINDLELLNAHEANFIAQIERYPTACNMKKRRGGHTMDKPNWDTL